MTQIDAKYLNQLRSAGLFVSHPYSPTHSFPSGVRIGKPTCTAGNSIPGYTDGYMVIGDAPLPPELDAPMVVLYADNDRWHVFAVDCCGGLGIGDFQNEWAAPEEAIQDILDLYLGNPKRMNLKAARVAESDRRARIKSSEELHFRHNAPLIGLSAEEKQTISICENAGLECRRNTAGPFRHGFTITRPKSVPGNSRYSYRDRDSNDPDAPSAWVYPCMNGKWHFEIGCFAGGPGAFAPGDFVNQHETLAGAIADVLDYYFGDESRMNPPELANVDQLRANGKYRGW